jgi:hypothetical protein
VENPLTRAEHLGARHQRLDFALQQPLDRLVARDILEIDRGWCERSGGGKVDGLGSGPPGRFLAFSRSCAIAQEPRGRPERGTIRERQGRRNADRPLLFAEYGFGHQQAASLFACPTSL